MLRLQLIHYSTTANGHERTAAMAQVYRTMGVDIGNSGLRIAELDPQHDTVRLSRRITWLAGSTTHDSEMQIAQFVTRPHSDGPRFSPTSTEWLEVINTFLDEIALRSSFCWLVSSVRRDALAVLAEFVAKRASDQWHVVTRHDLPLLVDVLEPDKVGIDRLLAASAASAMFTERPLIVMQAGSALTVDLVCEPRTFCGGAILPGVPMMLRLLGQTADMLPQIDADEITELPQLPGRNTEQAMRCGTASALVGGAQHLTDRYRQRFGVDTLIVLSGGDGMRIAQHLSPPLQIVPHLVLRGLLPLAAKASSQNKLPF